MTAPRHPEAQPETALREGYATGNLAQLVEYVRSVYPITVAEIERRALAALPEPGDREPAAEPVDGTLRRMSNFEEGRARFLDSKTDLNAPHGIGMVDDEHQAKYDRRGLIQTLDATRAVLAAIRTAEPVDGARLREALREARARALQIANSAAEHRPYSEIDAGREDAASEMLLILPTDAEAAALAATPAPTGGALDAGGRVPHLHRATARGTAIGNDEWGRTLYIACADYHADGDQIEVRAARLSGEPLDGEPSGG